MSLLICLKSGGFSASFLFLALSALISQSLLMLLA
jgi:hypothetical protein